MSVRFGRVLIATMAFSCGLNRESPPCLAQGSLTPPGGPTPTMKSLEQIASTGIAVNSTNTPGDSTYQFIISQPGSYYLPGNITGVASKSGIAIESNDVTLDLMGFEMVGAPTSQSAIYVPSTVNNICIRNGSFRGWGSSAAVVSISNASNSIVKDVRVADGLSSSIGGIYIGSGSVVADCVVTNFSATSSVGIVLVGSCTAIRCTVRTCNVGISTNGASSVIRECVVRDNQTGIGASIALVSHCTAYFNNGDGIQARGSCVVADCNASYNAQNHTSGTAGIHIMNDHNRIEGNLVTYNGYDGILADTSPTKATNNVIVRNHSGANNQFNYRVPGIDNSGQCCVGDNAIGPILGNSDVNTATNPFANLQD